MDNIYHPRYSKNTKIDEHFDEFRIKTHLFHGTRLDDLMVAMKFTGDSEAFKKLDESVSIKLLDQSADLRVTEYDPSNSTRKNPSVTVPIEALNLKTVAGLISQKGAYSYSHISRYQKYNKHQHIKLTVDNSQPDILPGAETLVVVRVYEPFK